MFHKSEYIVSLWWGDMTTLVKLTG